MRGPEAWSRITRTDLVPSIRPGSMLVAIFLAFYPQAVPAQGLSSFNNNYGGTMAQSKAFVFPTASEINPAVTAHAVLACLVWAFFIPVGGILLRLNLTSPWVVRLHMILQITSYLAYIAAVGLGIWVIETLEFGTFTLWTDPHPRLGLAILVLATIQPILGFIHHRIYQRRLAASLGYPNTGTNINTGKPTTSPAPPPPAHRSGRTTMGIMHLWLGRILIILGMINGGLGIRLAGSSPFQYKSTTRKAVIGYSVGVAVMGCLYFLVVALFEFRRQARERRIKVNTTIA